MLRALGALLCLVAFECSAAVYGPATSSGTHTISWDPYQPPSAYTVSSYTVQETFSGVSTNFTVPSSTTNKAFARTANGSYQYTVTAQREYCSPYTYECTISNVTLGSVTVSVTYVPPAPSAPGAISAPASDSDGSYDVSWGAALGDPTSYKLQQQFNGGAWATIADSPALTRAITVTTDGQYGYRVQACNANGCGPYTDVHAVAVALVPVAPGAVDVPAANATGNYSVAWGSALRAETYELAEEFNTTGWSAFGAQGNVLARAYSGKGDGLYRYRVRACNANGCGPVVTSSYLVIDRTPGRQVRFIHTDVLGSPAVETDETGSLD